jgi:N-methylhydantoinase B
MSRETWRVAQDVARGHVSKEAARRDYGVVMRGGEVDETATAALRAKARTHDGHFHFGPERDAFEAQWTDEAYACLTDILMALPVHWRFFVKTEVFRRMESRKGAEGVNAAYTETRERFPDIPHPHTHAEAAE